ncbi:MAG: PDZ domain-containing protein, partial [Nitrospirota bacterium]
LGSRVSYALKVEDLNGRIHINGGALDSLDRDPDGPPATAADFPLNPGAAAEVAPLVRNDVEDYHDTSMEGPNGFLVRLLNNLDCVVTGVDPDSGAEKAGLMTGDIIREINRQPVKSVKEFEKASSAIKKGDHVLILINRHGNALFLTAKV